MNLIEDLKWRHACKAMNGNKVPQEKIDEILEAIRLAPTSLGLQVYKVFVIENKAIREQIYAEACPQQPVIGCSHLLVFAARTEVEAEDYDTYFGIMQSSRNKNDEYIANYRAKIEGFVNDKVGANQPHWLVCQTYIGLGVACIAAANQRVDSVPIEGFSRENMDQVLGLKDKGYKSTVLLPLGYSDDANNWWKAENKLRKSKDQFIEFI